MKISLLNSHLFQSNGLVSKIQDTTCRDSKSDLLKSRNATEYILLAIRPWDFGVHRVMPVLDEWGDLVKFTWYIIYNLHIIKITYNLQTRIQFIIKIAICVIDKQFINKCIHRPKRVNLIWHFRNCSRNNRRCPVLTRLLGFHPTVPSVLVKIATIQSK